jgi:CheY-like chemotaxis protein
MRNSPTTSRWQYSHDWTPGCIVSDIGMPGKDVHSFIREVRALPPPLRTLPAFARSSDSDLAIEAGCMITEPSG